MKTDEVCGRPLDPFALHTHVTGLLSQQKGFRACGRGDGERGSRTTDSNIGGWLGMTGVSGLARNDGRNGRR